MRHAAARIPAAAWAALAGWVATLWLFYPGFASFDTAHQWYQVRHGAYSDHHPPLMALLWSLSEPLLPGPGGPFLAQVTVYWAALAVIAARLFARAPAQVAAVALTGLAPPLFVLLAHVWKDVQLMAWLLAVCAVLLIERGRTGGVPGFDGRSGDPDASGPRMAWPLAATPTPAPRYGLLVLAAALLAGIGALRHNGLAAAMPLAFYLAWRAGGGRLRPGRIAALGVLLFALIAVLSQLPARHPRVEPVQFWPTLALWDLAAVSILEGRVLIPESLHLRPLDPELLAEHFRPEVNVPLFVEDLFRPSIFDPYSRQELAALRSAWLALPIRHARAYLHHRWRLARAQVGLPGPGMPRPLDLMPGRSALADNPPIPVPDLPLRTPALAGLGALSGTHWLAGWPWLLASLPLAIVLWRQRRQRPHAPLGLALLASAWAYALPLLVLSASAELRYLSASLAAIAVAILIAMQRPRASAA